MSVPDQTVVVWRGEDLTVQCVATESTTITGQTFAVYITAATGGTPVLTLTSEDGDIAITDATDGVFQVSVSRTRTSALTSPLYRYSVWRTGSGTSQRLVGGDLVMKTDPRPTA